MWTTLTRVMFWQLEGLSSIILFNVCLGKKWVMTQTCLCLHVNRCYWHVKITNVGNRFYTWTKQSTSAENNVFRWEVITFWAHYLLKNTWFVRWFWMLKISSTPNLRWSSQTRNSRKCTSGTRAADTWLCCCGARLERAVQVRAILRKQLVRLRLPMNAARAGLDFPFLPTTRRLVYHSFRCLRWV